jgi:O-antigen/teichoic acid export membrane protein
MDIKMRLSALNLIEKYAPSALAHYLHMLNDIMTSKNPNHVARRMSLITFVIRLFNAAITFLSHIILARWMGKFEFGIFVLVWTTIIIGGSLSNFGFSTTLIRFIPEYRGKEQFEKLRGIIATGRLFAIFGATCVMCFGISFILFFENKFESYYIIPFIIGCVALPIISLGDTLEGISRAYSWPIKALAPAYIMRPTLILIFMVIALAMDCKPHAQTALIVSIIATYLTTISQLVSINSSLKTVVPLGFKSNDYKSWLNASFGLFFVDSFIFLLVNADVLFVGLFLKPDRVAIYFAASKILMLVHFVYFAVKAGVAQRYSQLIHFGKPTELEKFAINSAWWTFIPSLILGIIVLFLGNILLSSFGELFVEGYPLLFILIFGILCRASIGPAESLLNMSGNERGCAFIYGLTLGITILLAYIFIPIYELKGAGFAMTLGIIFETIALGVFVKKRLGIKVFIFSNLTLFKQ